MEQLVPTNHFAVVSTVADSCSCAVCHDTRAVLLRGSLILHPC